MEFFFVNDVMQTLNVSRSFAYKIIQQFNEELSEKGYYTIAGRVHKGYFLSRFYSEGTSGQPSAQQQSRTNRRIR